MDKKDFCYELPKELIAQTPLESRDSSRLLCLGRDSGELEHRQFCDLPELLRAGDLLVLNDSRVLPARLIGKRAGGGAAEVLLLREYAGDSEGNITGQRWECLVKPGRKIRTGAELTFGNGELTATLKENLPDGCRLVEFHCSGAFREILDKLGQMPLPPYINRQPDDPARYQTVYSRVPGSVAAPTAGLHFTEKLLDELKAKGVGICYITLHVGLGTFRPVKTGSIEEHIMHSEYFTITDDTAKMINKTHETDGRVIAVGTTSCRTLESASDCAGKVSPMSGETDIFIYPGYKFRCIDGLITNFHLPESTLIMLVAAFAGRERILSAYEKAKEKKYRFFSFGDAMLIL